MYTLAGVAPGGGLEAQGGSNRYEMHWKKRRGFAAVAHAAGVPIIPVFTENCREGIVNLQVKLKPCFVAEALYQFLQTGLFFWRLFYDITRLPITPMFGNFPVSMTTHVGEPIYPNEESTVEELREKTVRAMEALIKKHQRIMPGCYFKVREA